MADEPQGLTVLGRCGLRQPWLRLVSDQVKSWEWDSHPRRDPLPARHRLVLLKAKEGRPGPSRRA